MIIKWKTGSQWDNNIKRVECLRETEHFIIPRFDWGDKPNTHNRKEAKSDSYARHHDSWQAAHQYLLNRAGNKIDRLQKELAEAMKELEQIESMKAPE